MALVTGAASGIGAATARRLAAAGAHVVVADLRDGAETVRAIEQDGGSAVAAVADVRHPGAVQQLAEQTLAAWERVDLLVCSHGVSGPLAPLTEHGDDDWGTVIDVNLTGTFNCCRAVLPGMLARGAGRIVNVASVAGKEGNPLSSAYSASKAGVIGLTKSLAREVAEHGVVVNCVTPGVIESPMLAGGPELREYVLARTPMRRVGQPAEVAELIAWLCSDACSFTTGAVLDISGGRASY
ncbi:MAG TPA: SDR family NAD(P)-dependent oxidoreductase [Conexibacter sp.]|nr:SDR family NAD(P)-dependent oxidoreductase [Conexibacter sp.]